MLKILKKIEDISISTNLESGELKCRCYYPDCYYTIYDTELVEKFEELRTSCGNKPISISRSYSCDPWNNFVGGVRLSKHQMGLALDLIPPRTMDIEEFYYRAGQIFPFTILYTNKNIVHCDIYKR